MPLIVGLLTVLLLHGVQSTNLQVVVGLLDSYDQRQHVFLKPAGPNDVNTQCL